MVIAQKLQNININAKSDLVDNKSVFVGWLSFCAQRAGIALNGKSFGLEKPLVGMGGTPPPLDRKSAKLYREKLYPKGLKMVLMHEIRVKWTKIRCKILTILTIISHSTLTA